MCRRPSNEDDIKQPPPPPPQIRRLVLAIRRGSSTATGQTVSEHSGSHGTSITTFSSVRPPSDMSLANSNRVEQLSDKQKFLLFLKVMVLTIERNNDTRLLYQVRSTVHLCTALHRKQQQKQQQNVVGDNEGDKALEANISCQIRDLIGIQLYWNLTRDYLSYDV